MSEKNEIKLMEDSFQEIADKLVVYQIKTAWLQIIKLGDKMASKYDASLSMAFVLMAIFEEDGTPVTKIAPRIGMEPNSLSRVLKKLEEKNWVKRIQDKTDKRKVLVHLTEAGLEKRKIALKAVFKIEQDATKDIEPEKLNTFFEVMYAIKDRIEYGA